MPKNQRSRSSRGSNRSSERSAFSWGETARENPLVTAAAVGAAAAAGAFLWSRRNQISDQLSNLSDQFSEWTESMGSAEGEEFELESAGGGLGASRSIGTKTRPVGGRSVGTSRSVRGASGLSETGGGNASLGAQTGGGGMTTSASGRGRARSRRTT